MRTARTVERVFHSTPTSEGAGVRLNRVFGFHEVPAFDPFLLLDEIHSADPAEYTAGFPWHPHRGIETVTYVVEGEVRHGDSLGNSGTIRSGEVQWMTAGSGIIHEEMPQVFDGTFRLFQLWVNLPRANKMMAPRYQDLRAADIPVHETADGIVVRVIAGTYGGVEAPAKAIVIDPLYLDVSLPPDGAFTHPVEEGHTAFVHLLRGEGSIGRGAPRDVPPGSACLLSREGAVAVSAGGEGARFLLVAGRPLGEPVAWRGPIVMNTDEELALAFREYREGTFIR